MLTSHSAAAAAEPQIFTRINTCSQLQMQQQQPEAEEAYQTAVFPSGNSTNQGSAATTKSLPSKSGSGGGGPLHCESNPYMPPNFSISDQHEETNSCDFDKFQTLCETAIEDR